MALSGIRCALSFELPKSTPACWVGHANGTLSLHASRGGDLLLTAPVSDPRNGPINALILGENVIWIASANRGILVVSIETGECLFTIAVPGGALCMCNSACGRFVFTGGTDGRLSAWSKSTRRPIQRLEAHDGAVTCLASYVDANRSSIVVTGDDRGELAVWQPPADELTEQQVPLELVWKRKLTKASTSVLSGCFALSLTAENEDPVPKLWIGDSRGHLTVWDLRHRSIMVSPEVTHGDSLTCLFHDRNSDPSKVWSGSIDGTIIVWSALQVLPLYRLEQHHPVITIVQTASTVMNRMWICCADGASKAYFCQGADALVATERRQLFHDPAALLSPKAQSETLGNVTRRLDMSLETIDNLQATVRQLQVANTHMKAQMLLQGRENHANADNMEDAQLHSNHFFDLALLEMEDAEHFSRCQLSAIAFDVLNEVFDESFAHTMILGDATMRRCSRETEYWKAMLQQTQVDLEESKAAASELSVALTDRDRRLSRETVDSAAQSTATSPQRSDESSRIQQLHATITELNSKLHHAQNAHTEELIQLRQKHAEQLHAVESDRMREISTMREYFGKDRQRLEADLALLRRDKDSLGSAYDELKQRKTREQSNEVETLKLQLREVQNKLTTVEGQLHESLATLQRDSEMELVAIRTSLSHSKKDADDLRQQLRCSDETILRLRGELSSSISMASELQQQLTQQREEIHRSTSYHEVDRSIDAHREESAKELTVLQQEARALKAVMEQEREEATRNEKRLQDDLLAMRGPWEAMKSALRDSQVTLEEVKSQFIKDVAELEDIIDEREKEIAVLRQQLSERATTSTKGFPSRDYPTPPPHAPIDLPSRRSPVPSVTTPEPLLVLSHDAYSSKKTSPPREALMGASHALGRGPSSTVSFRLDPPSQNTSPPPAVKTFLHPQGAGGLSSDLTGIVAARSGSRQSERNLSPFRHPASSRTSASSRSPSSSFDFGAMIPVRQRVGVQELRRGAPVWGV